MMVISLGAGAAPLSSVVCGLWPVINSLDMAALWAV